LAKRYTRLNFENRPSVKTPVNDVNLNIMDKGIDDLDNAIEEIYNTELPTKAPNSHASTSNIYGLGTTGNYGHVKTINSLSQSIHTDGTALSAYQGYVLDKGKLNIGDDYRPNLLINGDFQIWQRGESFDISSIKYTTDRWVANASVANGLRVSKASEGLKLTWLLQCLGVLIYRIEETSKPLNRPITLTIKIDGLIYGYTTQLNNLSSYIEFNIDTKTFYTRTTGGTNNQLLYFNGNGAVGSTYTVSWVKLELNDHPTPFIPRSYGEELALCQRYYEFSDISADNSYQLQANSTKSLLGGILFKVKKRVNPTVGIASQIRRINTGDLITVVGSYNASADTNGMKYIDNINVSSPPFIIGEWYSFAYIADAEI
jgi:hypothetical protein